VDFSPSVLCVNFCVGPGCFGGKHPKLGGGVKKRNPPPPPKKVFKNPPKTQKHVVGGLGGPKVGYWGGGVFFTQKKQKPTNNPNHHKKTNQHKKKTHPENKKTNKQKKKKPLLDSIGRKGLGGVWGGRGGLFVVGAGCGGPVVWGWGKNVCVWFFLGFLHPCWWVGGGFFWWGGGLPGALKTFWGKGWGGFVQTNQTKHPWCVGGWVLCFVFVGRVSAGREATFFFCWNSVLFG